MKFATFLEFIQNRIVTTFSPFQYQDSFQCFESFLCVICCFINFNICILFLKNDIFIFLRDRNGNYAFQAFLCICVYCVLIIFCIFLSDNELNLPYLPIDQSRFYIFHTQQNSKMFIIRRMTKKFFTWAASNLIFFLFFSTSSIEFFK